MMCTLCINYYLKNPALPKYILLLIVIPVENAENAVDEPTWLSTQRVSASMPDKDIGLAYTTNYISIPND